MRPVPLNASERRHLADVVQRRKLEGVPCEQVERAIRVLEWVDARQRERLRLTLAQQVSCNLSGMEAG